MQFKVQLYVQVCSACLKGLEQSGISWVMATTLPVLLPDRAIPRAPSTANLEWTPTQYRSAPQPPPTEDAKIQDGDARQIQMLDGKLIKKTRPRRTVDYNGGMGRWALVRLVVTMDFINLPSVSVCQMRKIRPNPSYVPCLRPSPPYIIDVGGI